VTELKFFKLRENQLKLKSSQNQHPAYHHAIRDDEKLKDEKSMLAKNQTQHHLIVL
jgi:hypothetical protein